MNILFAASEAAPLVKSGGLGDVAGSLPRALKGLGHDVRLVIPCYGAVDSRRHGLKRAASFHVPIASWNERCDVLRGTTDTSVPVYCIRKDAYYDRPGLYGGRSGDYPDNAERFIFFARSVLEACRALRFQPDVIHCNDWQTGMVPVYLNRLYQDDRWLGRAASVFTIHNLGYQGLFPSEDMRLTGLGWDVFTPEGIEFWGKINFLKAGLIFADTLTTVSPTYSREIQTPEHGHGLDGVLVKRSADLFGILNGIDERLWDPARDRSLPRNFSAADHEGKKVCTRELRQRVGLPGSDAPVIGMVTRIAGQKGLDIVIEALPDILALGAQVVILGTGDELLGRMLEDMAGRHSGLRFLYSFDDALARLIYAGSDLFLMPSRYEPCGLSQMIALRYGAVPIVRRTGGLADTVIDHDPATGRGTGFQFEDPSSKALTSSVRRALAVFRDPRSWSALMLAGMRQDFSWKHSAGEYVKVYRKAVKNQAGIRVPEAVRGGKRAIRGKR